MRILFVCLGNICRSPTAEAVMRGKVAATGLAETVEVESAGTGDWHVGEPPDQRACDAAERRGLELGGRARVIEPADFERYEMLIAMDRSNEADLHALAPDEEHRKRVSLLRSWDPAAAEAGELDVPDPYWSGAEGFDRVIDLVARACDGLIAEIEQRLARERPATGARERSSGRSACE